MVTVSGIFDEMERMRRELDRVMGGAERADRHQPFSRFSFLPGRSARSYPLVNVSEHKDGYTIEALAPGLDLETLDISATHRQIVLSGSKTRIPATESVEACHRSERAGGEFRRTVELGSDIDPKKVAARYSDGLLTLTVPKAEAAKARTIPITTD